MDLTHFTFDLDENGIATVLMDRAGEEMNTLAPELSDDLAAVLDRLEQDPAIRGVVWGSAKPDNFHAGADIRAFADLDEASAAQTLQNVQEAFSRIERLTTSAGKPVVAAIHGACLGGGLELALACSARISSDNEATTQFGQPEVKLGLLPGAGGTQRLPRLIGIAAALDLILTGRTIRPRRAVKLGLVDAAVPADRLLETARHHARAALDPAPAPPVSFADRAKQLLQPSELQSLALERNRLGRTVLFP